MSQNRTQNPRWWLRCPHGDAPLSERELLMGRDVSCHLRFEDDPLISRVHARVYVESNQVFLEDLGSTNGTFVDEQRITGRRELGTGTRVRLGGQSLWLYLGVNPPRGPRSNTTAAEAPSGRQRDSERAGSTDNASIFSLVGPTAERALKNGQTEEVLRILEPYLDQILSDARARKSVDPAVVAEAHRYALKLASATGHGSWIDYVVELSEACSIPVPADVRASLPQAVQTADGVERDWVKLLR